MEGRSCHHKAGPCSCDTPHIGRCAPSRAEASACWHNWRSVGHAPNLHAGLCPTPSSRHPNFLLHKQMIHVNPVMSAAALLHRHRCRHCRPPDGTADAAALLQNRPLRHPPHHLRRAASCRLLHLLQVRTSCGRGRGLSPNPLQAARGAIGRRSSQLKLQPQRPKHWAVRSLRGAAHSTCRVRSSCPAVKLGLLLLALALGGASGERGVGERGVARA